MLQIGADEDRAHRCGDCNTCARGSQRAGGAVMRSRASEFESSKASGDVLEGEIDGNHYFTVATPMTVSGNSISSSVSTRN